MSDADAPQSRKKRGELRPARKIREEWSDGGRMGRGRKRKERGRKGKVEEIAECREGRGER